MIEEGRPIFLQIAEQIENDIIDRVYAEEQQVPSTNEFAAYYRINPATAAKGVGLLVDRGVLYKKRGIGMFVATGATATLVAQRQDGFFAQYVLPMIGEARKLGITPTRLSQMISEGDEQQ